jgi:hypothetical protein
LLDFQQEGQSKAGREKSTKSGKGEITARKYNKQKRGGSLGKPCQISVYQRKANQLPGALLLHLPSSSFIPSLLFLFFPLLPLYFASLTFNQELVVRAAKELQAQENRDQPFLVCMMT